ncbi:MAG: pilus assembly protein PilX [Oscillospiraceae bacterium]|nr:pilus assembly protein PilX [Oscillospiraceae bacterium]
MRKCNAILTAAILLLFLLHAILGSFQLAGLGGTAAKPVAWAAAVLILVHTGIGVKFTADTLRVWKKTGVSYFRENRLFWARRISGFAVMALLLFHFTAFGDSGGAAYRLKYFGRGRLAAQLLLVAAIALHVLTNVKPMLISFGVRSLKPRAGDILFVLSVLLLFFTAAFVVYYLRWNQI